MIRVTERAEDGRQTPQAQRWPNPLGLFLVGCMFVTLLFGPGNFTSPWGLAVVAANVLALLGGLAAVFYMVSVLLGYDGGGTDAE